MDTDTRIELRNRLLKELYDIYFGENARFRIEENEQLSKDKEKELAYEYLVQKSFITKEFPGGRRVKFTINAYGIDEIESLEKEG